jgi:hypothetical protein
MSHLSMTKELDGHPVVFVRFDGPESLIVKVAGTERIVTRKQWDTLPERLPSKGTQRL